MVEVTALPTVPQQQLVPYIEMSLPDIVSTCDRSSSSFHLQCTFSFRLSSKEDCKAMAEDGDGPLEIGPLKMELKH